MALSAPGIGSNLDVNGIVTQLMALERQPLTSLDKKEASYQAKLTAYGSIKGAISAFQSAMAGLSTGARFAAYSATSSSAATLGATVNGSPAAGRYSVEITTLAQAQKLVSAGRASDTASIGTGATTTITFDFGTISGGAFDSTTGRYTGSSYASGGAGTKTVTISDNNTLGGIRDAINAAKVGVTASIVNDGSGSPYRLVLSSDNTGADQSLKISVNGDATIGALLAHDPSGTQNLSETVTATDAALKVDGIAISKDTNVVTDAIPGVTLTLLQKTTDAPVTVNVAQETSPIVSSVNAFVKAYNDVNKALNDATAYNASTKQAAVLNGEATVRSLQTRMRSVFASQLGGIPGAYTLLSQIGVSFQRDGTLAVDATKLQSAMAANPNAIAALFAATGSASAALTSYRSATSATKPGSYALTVDAIATQGLLEGSSPAGLTITAGVNDLVDMEVDGIPVTVSIPAGTYSANTLAAQVQSVLNGATELSSAGLAVTVTENGGVLSIRSNQYGSNSSVEVTGGIGATDLFGAAPVATSGLNAAGSINGRAATGFGQVLAGPSGDDAEGLRVAVTGGPIGPRGTVFYSTGYAQRLQALAAQFLATDGAVTARTDGIKRSIDDIGNRRDALEQRMVSIEARYRAQFTALDTMMSSMTKTSTFLQQQLANLPKAG